MKLVFMGTPEMAVPTLQNLHSARHEILAVYTQPPRPAGRGQALQKSPVHSLAEQLNLPVFTPEKITPDVVAAVKALAPDLIAVIAYGHILPQALLDIAPCLNTHFSNLPRWRGAAPLQWSLLAGDTQSAICIAHMVQALDAGPVYVRDPFTISADATHGELYDFCAHRGADLLVELLENPLPSPVPQPTEGITKAPKITPDLRTLNWRSVATELHNRVRAFSPTPGAIAYFRGQPVKIISTTVIEQNAPHSTAGSILKADKTGLWVACQTGTLGILTLQPAGKKPMPVADFINGFQPKVGEVFDKKMDTL